MYRIETTDPVSGKLLRQLIDMPYVIVDQGDDSLVIYFETEQNRQLYLQNPHGQRFRHQK